jgi:hypothetical protein
MNSVFMSPGFPLEPARAFVSGIYDEAAEKQSTFKLTSNP